jgi:mono/diheme cytochrome c family protein
MDGRTAWIFLPLVAWACASLPPPRDADDIDRALVAAGKVGYTQYCTPCHGEGGAPGKVPVDLRTYVARHGGKFPAGDWLTVIADARPGAIHTDVWDRIQRDQSTRGDASASARGMVGQIARYVNSIQSK